MNLKIWSGIVSILALLGGVYYNNATSSSEDFYTITDDLLNHCYCSPQTNFCSRDAILIEAQSYLDNLKETDTEIEPLSEIANEIVLSCEDVDINIKGLSTSIKFLEDPRMYRPRMPNREDRTWYPSLEAVKGAAGRLVALKALEDYLKGIRSTGEDRLGGAQEGTYLVGVMNSFASNSLKMHTAAAEEDQQDSHKKADSFFRSTKVLSTDKDMYGLEKILVRKIVSEHGPKCDNPNLDSLLEQWNGWSANWSYVSKVMLDNKTLPNSVNYFPSFFGSQRTAQPFIPCLVLFPRSSYEVLAAINLTLSNNLEFTVKGGGHSSEHLSMNKGGVVIDTTKMTGLEISEDYRGVFAEIEAGNLLINIYEYLYTKNRYIIPGGSCPSVGVVGLATGGGYGYSTLAYGMLTDSLEQVEMVTQQNGRLSLIVADRFQNEDVYKACRGGWCANSGVITKLKFRVQQVPKKIVYFFFHWHVADGVKVISHWQEWLKAGNAGRMGSLAIMMKWVNKTADCSGVSVVEMKGQFMGNLKQFEKEVKDSLLPPNLPYANHHITESDFLSAVLYLGGCDIGKVDSCKTKAQDWGSGGRTLTDFVERDKIWDDKTISLLVDRFSSHKKREYLDLSIRLFGFGEKVWTANETTTWNHRDGLFIIQYMLDYTTTPKYHLVATNTTIIEEEEKWLRDTKTIMSKYTKQTAYQNFVDIGLGEKWAEKYFGSDLKYLTEVKEKYDPENVFKSHHQTITPRKK